MNKLFKLSPFILFFIVILMSSVYFIAHQRNNHIVFPEEITMIRCLEFDGSITEYKDVETLNAVMRILHNSNFAKDSSAEPYIGTYMFEFCADEKTYSVGIGKDHFILDGELYIVDEDVNKEILNLLNK